MDELKNVLPALRNMKDFERLLKSNHNYIVLLETRLGQLKALVSAIRKEQKKVLVHADLIHGLKTDDYGMEYLIREVKPDGIVSTRGKVISLAKKNNLLAIQRLFILDSQALDHNVKIINRTNPDYIEVLPGVIPSVINEIHLKTGIPVIAGGLIRSNEDIQSAYEGGAVAVSTSEPKLWDL